MFKFEIDNKKIQINIDDLKNIVKIVDNKIDNNVYNKTSNYNYRLNTGIKDEE